MQHLHPKPTPQEAATRASRLTLELKPVARPLIGRRLWGLRSVRRSIRDAAAVLERPALMDALRVVATEMPAEEALRRAVASAVAPAGIKSLSHAMLAKVFSRHLRAAVELRSGAEPARQIR